MAGMEDEINKAIKILKSGGIILYPTDTIWGLGCDPDNTNAIIKICSIKKRNNTRGMLILVDSSERILNYVEKMPELAYDLIEQSDKPLTIIYDGAKNLAPNLISSNGSIGIRVSRENFSKNLIKRYNKPIVSTSANISGQKSPGFFAEINRTIIDSVDYVVNWKHDEKIPASASGIIKLGISGEVEIIRK